MKNNKEKRRNKKIAAMALAMAVVGTNASSNVFAAGLELADIFKWSSATEYSWSRKVVMIDADADENMAATPEPSISPSATPKPSISPSGAPESSVNPSSTPKPSVRPLQPSESVGETEPVIPSFVPGASVAPEYSGEPIASEEVEAPSTWVPTPSSSENPGIPVPTESKEPSVEESAEPTPGGDASDNTNPPIMDTAPPAMDTAPPYATQLPDDIEGSPNTAPTKKPGGYMAGDPQFIPNIFDSTDKKHNNSESTSGGASYWGSYSTVYSSNDSVVLPGILSDVLQIEKETSLKQSESVKWGEARTKQLSTLTKPSKAVETIPGTTDSTDVEWVFPALAGSAITFAMCCRRKQEKTE